MKLRSPEKGFSGLKTVEDGNMDDFEDARTIFGG